MLSDDLWTNKLGFKKIHTKIFVKFDSIFTSQNFFNVVYARVLFCIYTHARARTHTDTYCAQPIDACTYSNTQCKNIHTHTHFLIICLCPPRSHSHTHTHKHTQTHSHTFLRIHTHTLAHTLSLSRSLFLSLALSLSSLSLFLPFSSSLSHTHATHSPSPLAHSQWIPTSNQIGGPERGM